MNESQKLLMESYKDMLDAKDIAPIADQNRRYCTAQLLENQIKFLKESTPENVAAGVQNYDPVLISLVRRSAPNLMAYDIMGVQPMTGPTGIIFALRSRYSSQAGTEALFNEADTSFSGTGTHGSVTSGGITGGDPVKNFGVGSYRYNGTSMNAAIGRAKTTAAGEGNITAKMGFSIEKISITAGTRALAAGYSTELAQDFRQIHGGDAEQELANILQTEILSEMNRELVRTVNVAAKTGSQTGVTNAGTFDLDTDSNGRWMGEKFKGLLFQIEREANVIAKETRRGRGNVILCSADVASALSLSGALNYAPALSTNLNVDDTGNTFAGILLNKFKVYIDPYFVPSGNYQYFTVGYRGPNPIDAGLYYCPYVPLQMYRAVDPDSFQPKLALKTRYAITENPFVQNAPSTPASTLTQNRNQYYRISRVASIL